MAGLGASASGDARPVGPCGSVFYFAGTSGASDSRDDAFQYRGFHNSSVKGEKESPALDKADVSRAFHKVVSLITSFFPHAKLSSSMESYPWMDVFGSSHCRDPRIFFSLFDKLSSVSKEVNEKFRKATDDKKKASTDLPHWGDTYRLGDLSDFHKAPKVNKSFLRLLDKPVSSSHYITLPLDDTGKLESCVRGQIKSQSFSL